MATGNELLRYHFCSLASSSYHAFRPISRLAATAALSLYLVTSRAGAVDTRSTLRDNDRKQRQRHPDKSGLMTRRQRLALAEMRFLSGCEVPVNTCPALEGPQGPAGCPGT